MKVCTRSLLRFPQWILEAACLCKGCIEPVTRKHTHSGISKSVKVKIGVIYRKPHVSSFDKCTRLSCYEKLIDVDVACHCYLPSI